MSLLNGITISIGDELLSGKTVDSNNAFISTVFSRVGIKISKKLIIGDVNENIKKALNWSLAEADVVTITGGLGPTHDDITKQALCEFFGVELKTHPEILESLKTRFSKRGFEFPKSNASQAEYPANAEILHNSVGTAQGMYFVHDGSHLFVMPGVPAEMRAITNEQIIPRLRDMTGAIQESIDIHSIGMPESQLYEVTKPVLDEYKGAKVAYLPKHFVVTIRVSYDSEEVGENAEKLAEIYARLSQQLPENIYGRNDESLSSVVGAELLKRQATVATAESCTGGLIASMITDISGSSDYFNTGFVTYANETKMAVLGVQEETLMHGAVSEETVAEMLSGTLERSGSDYAIAVSGVAGPTGGTEEKPVGTVYIGVAGNTRQYIKRFQFGSHRVLNKQLSAFTALNLLRLLIRDEL
ncbi:MAG: competence/damage-inducible protein A [Candidatus Marinimicrobia bacterium]|nr:competence/damage-inducible protein A [Candidatus Neomarinimicrobiota bacterium]MCF7850988.1 competence/damage-inducible protein A [Candidatus Neomarinimicrobiota bacterium]